MDWLILLVLVPVVTVSIVLLLGFAGCTAILGYEDAQLAPAPPATTAKLFLIDTATQGSWHGKYGFDGYNVINDGVKYPDYVDVTLHAPQDPNGKIQNPFTWDDKTLENRAMQKVDVNSVNRLAAAAFGDDLQVPGQLSVDLNFKDGRTHRVAFYLLDFDTTMRAQDIKILDAKPPNIMLGSQRASGFQDGQYQVWEIQGQVRVEFAKTAGNNAVLSGLFFDT